MDWNWFFSSVAQSVAALVGVLGAFLISRLLNNESSYSRCRARTRQLIRESENLTDCADGRYFDWYNTRTLKEGLGDVVYEMQEIGDADRLPPEEYYRKFDFSPYLPKEQVLLAIEKSVDEELERQRKPKTPRGILDFAITPLPHVTNPAFSVAARQDLREEREAIAQLVFRIKNHIREVREHLDVISAHPERSGAIRIALAAILFLFLGGVILPLMFLPVDSGSIPGWSSMSPNGSLLSIHNAIVAMVTLLFAALVVALAVLNERLRHPDADLVVLDHWLTPGSYSGYLRVRLENGFPL